MTSLQDHFAKESPKNIPANVRQTVLERDGYQCQLCGTSGEGILQLHHLTYRSQGGGHVADNLIVLCFRCHEDVHAGRQSVLLVEIEPGTYRAFPGAPTKPKR